MITKEELQYLGQLLTENQLDAAVQRWYNAIDVEERFDCEEECAEALGMAILKWTDNQ